MLAFASRSLARELAAGLPRQDYVYITIVELFRFDNIEFYKILCKLESTENPRLFDK